MSISPFTRWLSVAAFVFVVTVICGLCLIALTPKVYVATAQIKATPRYERFTDALGVSARPRDEQDTSDEFEMIRSPEVLLPIIADLGLDKAWAKRIHRSAGETLPPADALAYLKSHLKLNFVREANVTTISVSDDNPTEAANIANAIADRYKVMRDVEEDQRTHRGLDTLREQIAAQEKVVSDARVAIDRARMGLNGPHADLDVMNKDLLNAQEDYDARQVLLNEVGKLPDDQFLDALDGLGHDMSKSAVIRQDIAAINADISKLLNNGASEKDQRVSTLRTELDLANKQLADTVVELRRKMQIDCDMAHTRVTLLEQQVEIEKAKEDSEPRLRTLRDAERTLKQAQAILNALNLRLKQVVADSALMESPVRIIARAEAPSHPIQPDVPLDLLIFAVAGLELGIVVASFVELLIWLRRWPNAVLRVATRA